MSNMVLGSIYHTMHNCFSDWLGLNWLRNKGKSHVFKIFWLFWHDGSGYVLSIFRSELKSKLVLIHGG